MTKLLTRHHPIAVRFVDVLPRGYATTEDEVSSALAHAAKHGRKIAIDCRRKRFSAGSYFACNYPIPIGEVVRTYVRREHVFPDAATARAFLSAVGCNPARSRYILLAPASMRKADVIILLVHAAQGGRILGLAAHCGHLSADVVPAAPTCAALYRPLLKPGCIHVNFIDYFDRDSQARGCFAEGEFLVSMIPAVYKQLCAIARYSAHGTFSPKNLPVYP